MSVHWMKVTASEAVEQVGYDPVRRALHVVYTGGREYAYYGVPTDELEALAKADSVGQFVNWRIKPRYKFQEIGAARPTPFARRTLGRPSARPARPGA